MQISSQEEGSLAEGLSSLLEEPQAVITALGSSPLGSKAEQKPEQTSLSSKSHNIAEVFALVFFKCINDEPYYLVGK